MRFVGLNHQESDAISPMVFSKNRKNAIEKPIQVLKKKKSKDTKITYYYLSKSKSTFLSMCMTK